MRFAECCPCEGRASGAAGRLVIREDDASGPRTPPDLAGEEQTVVVRNLSGALIVISAFVALTAWFAGLQNPDEDPCSTAPLPRGAVPQGMAVAYNSNQSMFPLGWTCTYKMSDGSFSINPLEGWPATWLFYGSLGVLGISIPTFAASTRPPEGPKTAIG
jgi:hypothetical protein